MCPHAHLPLAPISGTSRLTKASLLLSSLSFLPPDGPQHFLEICFASFNLSGLPSVPERFQQDSLPRLAVLSAQGQAHTVLYPTL